MKVICNNEIIELEGALSTSLKIKNCTDETFVLPEKYLKYTKINLVPFSRVLLRIELARFLTSTGELIDENLESDDISKTLSEIADVDDIYDEIFSILNDRMKMFKFYEYLKVDNKELIKLSREIGQIIDDCACEVHISDTLGFYISKYYPNLLRNQIYYSDSLKKFSQDRPKKVETSASIYHLEDIFLRSKLIECSKSGNLNAVSALLRRLGPQNYQKNFYDAFIHSCTSENTDLLEFLYDKNSDIHYIMGDLSPYTSFAAISFLIGKGLNLRECPRLIIDSDPKILAVLIQHGYNFDVSYVFYTSCKYQDIDTLNNILVPERKLDVNLIDSIESFYEGKIGMSMNIFKLVYNYRKPNCSHKLFKRILDYEDSYCLFLLSEEIDVDINYFIRYAIANGMKTKISILVSHCDNIQFWDEETWEKESDLLYEYDLFERKPRITFAKYKSILQKYIDTIKSEKDKTLEDEF